MKLDLSSYDLFSPPIEEKKVREDVTAYRYPNGVINIKGQKYIGWSMTDAIRLWRKAHPKHAKQNV